jgi:hypothetical protein
VAAGGIAVGDVGVLAEGTGELPCAHAPERRVNTGNAKQATNEALRMRFTVCTHASRGNYS